jgi:serine protease
MQAAINDAVARGIVVVAAAGNKAGLVSQYAPGNCQNVISVAASTQEGQLAFYSNFGPEVDLMAPGGDTFADRDGDGRPDGILVLRRLREKCAGFDDPAGRADACDYGFIQGGSSATAITSAAIALMMARTGEGGRALEERFLTRAVRPVPVTACTIECTKNQNATPIEGQAGMCMRACGRGILDMTNAL